jgi:hypothetical protein
MSTPTTVDASESEMTAALELIRQGCARIAAIDGGSESAKRLRPAIILLKEAAEISRSVPEAGDSGALRWRLYQAVQGQEGSTDSAFYKELRCSIHLGLAGENSDPVTLPCGHSFCKTCIAPLYAATVLPRNRACPQCRERITVEYSSLMPNVAIKGVVDHLLPLGTVRDTDSIVSAESVISTPYSPYSYAYDGGGGNNHGSHYYVGDVVFGQLH